MSSAGLCTLAGQVTSMTAQEGLLPKEGIKPLLLREMLSGFRRHGLYLVLPPQYYLKNTLTVLPPVKGWHTDTDISTET